MKDEKGRTLFIGIGAAAGILFIAALSLIAGKGSKVGVLLLDWSDPYSWILPYPLTIQNLMSLVFFAALGDVAWRWTAGSMEARARGQQLLPEDDRTVLVDTDLPGVRSKALATPPSFLVRLIDQVVLFFQANRTTSHAHDLLNSMVDLEMHRVDLGYTLLRYCAWLLPALGFLGTVYGISLAILVLKAGTGKEQMDMVIGNLSTAFNTTILGLLQSMVLVFLMGRAQQREEAAVNAGADYCLKNLVNRLYVPEKKQ